MSFEARAQDVMPTTELTAVANEGEPHAAYSYSPSLLALQTPARGPTALAIQKIAAQIIVHQLELGRRGVTICSPSRGAGVTFVATNLAISLAMAGASVLLVDANLHEPGIDEMIRPRTPSPGLRDMLTDGLHLVDTVHHDVIPGLSVLYSGGATSGASELLALQACDAILADCLRDFDYTIVDTPPANRAADARRMGSVVGYSLIVARRNLTYVNDVSTLSGELVEDGVEIIGTLLNAA